MVIKNRRFEDLSLRKFGRLQPIKVTGFYVHKSGKTRIWKCKCDCGKIIYKPCQYLTSGDTKSCGCLRKDLLIKSGMSHTRFYKIFNLIQNRCFNEKKDNYHEYGGRGIKCLWNSFEDFKNDMYESYKKHTKRYGEKNTSIDRIDNNGDYSPLNCRWATMKEQSRNKRNSIYISFDGISRHIKDWAKIKNIKYPTLFRRFKYGKKTIEHIFDPI